MDLKMLEFKGETIEAPAAAKEVVLAHSKKVDRKSLSSFTTSLFATPIVMFTATVSTGLPVLLGVANGVIGVILGAGVGLSVSKPLDKPRWSFLRRNYSPQVAEWLHKTYNITVAPDALLEITSIILGDTPNAISVFTDVQTNEKFRLAPDGRSWVVQREQKVLTENKTQSITVFAKIAHFDGDSYIYETVRRKIMLLQKMPLTNEDSYAFNRAAAETDQSVHLVKKLQDLEDPDYLAVFEEALHLINEDLDTIIKSKKKEILSEFKNQQLRLSGATERINNTEQNLESSIDND